MPDPRADLVAARLTDAEQGFLKWAMLHASDTMSEDPWRSSDEDEEALAFFFRVAAMRRRAV